MLRGPLDDSRNDATRPTVLLVDDEAPLLRTLRRAIEPAGFSVVEASNGVTVRQVLPQEPELVLLDLKLGDTSGFDLIRDIHEESPQSEIIVMTGYASIDSAVASMRAGVFDYLEKPFGDPLRVVQTLQRALERRTLRARNRELEGELDRRSALERVVAESPGMRAVKQRVVDLSHVESTVLIQAESGTGKELIARAIHETSPRRERPFAPVDCGALPEGIAEGELFGHERGAFTGAIRSAMGVFRAADGGTLFLDEIGELPLALQAKILRAIQEREVKPLGTETAQAVNVRIVAATNRDLDAEVKSGRFRADLFYRLCVVGMRLPRLRDRPEDIPVLATHFMHRYARGTDIAGFEPEALERLLAHSWDGNVRELENCVEAAMALARGPRLTVLDLGLAPLGGAGGDANEAHAVLPAGIELSLAAYERACLEEALRRTDGDVRRAARMLGIGRSTLYRKLSTLGISTDPL